MLGYYSLVSEAAAYALRQAKEIAVEPGRQGDHGILSMLVARSAGRDALMVYAFPMACGQAFLTEIVKEHIVEVSAPTRYSSYEAFFAFALRINSSQKSGIRNPQRGPPPNTRNSRCPYCTPSSRSLIVTAVLRSLYLF